jgi:DNA-binding GntR family transcriptional regulator
MRDVSRTQKSLKERTTPTPSVQSSPFRVYSGVMQGLYEGRFAPGQRLIEADLSRIYGVSRNSVREALHRLAAERIVSLNLHRGAQIRQLTREEAKNILELLELLIGLSARLAAKEIKAKESQKYFQTSLSKLLSFEKKADSFEFLKARNAFYRAMVEIGGNLELGRVLPSMHVHLLRVQFRAYDPTIQQESFLDYKRLGEAVLAGDIRRAEAAGQAHVRRIAKAYLSLPDDAFSSNFEDGSLEW